MDKDVESDLELGQEEGDDAATAFLPSIDISEDHQEPSDSVPSRPAISMEDDMAHGIPASSDQKGWHAGIDVGGYISRQQGPSVLQ